MSKTYKIKGVTFDFLTLNEFKEETKSLKKVLTILIPYIKSYLKGKKIIKTLENRVKKAGYHVHLIVTRPIKYGKENVAVGSVGFDGTGKHMFMTIGLVNVIDSSSTKFELVRTMVHEILHLFIKGEKNVIKSTNEFMNSLDFKDKRKILKDLLNPKEFAETMRKAKKYKEKHPQNNGVK